MSHIQSIQAEFLFEFANKQEWIDKAQSWFSPYLSNAEKTICLDTGGNVLTVGKDFTDAEVLKTYPVKVYRLVRVSEVYANIAHDIFRRKVPAVDVQLIGNKILSASDLDAMNRDEIKSRNNLD